MVGTQKLSLFLICCSLAMIAGCDGGKKTESPIMPEPKKMPKKEMPAKEKPMRSVGIKEINTPEEFEMVLTNGRPTLIFWHSLTCPPCNTMEPIVAELAKKYDEKIDFVSMIASNKNLNNLFDEYKVEAYPTFVFLNSAGKEHKRKVGGSSKADFEKMIIEFRDQTVKP